MWHFRKKSRGEKIRDPIQGEFFATEAITSPAEALVRESIQNSLDAGIEKTVRVRMYLGRGKSAVPGSNAAQLFDGAWQHFGANGNGLRSPPAPGDECPYLVVEDFGTSGLIGDPEQSDPMPGVKNPFFLFFRAEGLSEKGEKDRGRWGVGKFVFPRSSQISSHFGLTVRHDDKATLLLGAATLKSHMVNGQSYCPDGLFGTLDTEDFVLPIAQQETIDNFRRHFSLTRGLEPGLSVVVPFVDPEISFDDLLLAAAKDYFLPIMEGTLEVSIETSEQSAKLTAATLSSTLEAHRDRLGPDLAAFVELARWGSDVADGDRITTKVAGEAGSPKWSKALLADAALETIRTRIANHESIAVRVPIVVRPIGRDPEQSYFDILLRPDRQSDGRPLFAREGIIVSDVKGGRAREFRSLVIVNDAPLATLLGDSENPAHTQWQKDSSNFRGRYKFGPGCLDFVTGAVSEFMKAVNRSEVEEDPSLTVDFFSLPADDDAGTQGVETKRRKKKRDGGKDKIQVPKPHPAQILIRPRKGGFSIHPGPAAPAPPFLLHVTTAFDVRSGNPVKRYHPADFDLSRSEFDMTTASRGITVSQRRNNSLIVQVSDADFNLVVDGFDQARDVYVRAVVRSPESDSAQG